ncbi:MAG: bifunctional 2-polyprenyl-6-hydroxyphenol methylase/3-demethylubiquinol 3-O-methyltransferase UbiG [Roseateles sp.]|uniref:bifunctional 2-polyprenyl-6-hydroxyphenol methylase/3-demethylubiquinol 3-O-methyltransferase UbiG n=1 Tax=Roseateles sp. TaxID=1971397 RepID=UPI0040368075
MSEGARSSTVIPAEVARFDAWSATWWNPQGPMRPLHVTNALRLDWVRDAIRRHHAGRTDLSLLDVGCGGGLMAEPLARDGLRVVGIDASAGNIGAARRHAGELPALDYRVGEPTVALRPDERFDIVLALEVVEHLDDVPAFLAQVAGHVAPGGLLIASTINRTARSWLFAIAGAEYILRVLPVGTHRWQQFVTPAELEAAATRAGLRPLQRLGMRYLPLLHRASWTRDTSVNYLASFARPALETAA